MIQNVLHHIGGIGVYGIVSVCLFFALFIGMLIWAVCLKKTYLESMRDLPLDGDETSSPAAHPGRPPHPNPDHE
jgi:hypothetical protein